MLVLTRSCDEEIRIGDNVIVRVLDVRGDRVRLGIQAPADIPVHRQEIYEEIERANRESTQVARSGLEGAAALLGKQGSLAPRDRLKKHRPRPAAKRKSTEVKHGT